MQDRSQETVYYKRSRFSSRLPVDRLYAPSHFWLKEVESGVWRVGFTKFATRMLGELVEYSVRAKEGDSVIVGQEIAWIEGFKAVTDVYCVINGTFIRANPAIEQDVTLTDQDPYGEGWLYEVRGQPEPDAVDVQGYITMLDLTIEKMKEKMGPDESAPPKNC